MLIEADAIIQRRKRPSKAPDLYYLAGIGKLPMRYAMLDSLVRWVDSRNGIGTPNIYGFYAIVGGRQRMNWSNFYRCHYRKLIDEDCLIDDKDDRTGARALVITPKARALLELQHKAVRA